MHVSLASAGSDQDPLVNRLCLTARSLRTADREDRAGLLASDLDLLELAETLISAHRTAKHIDDQVALRCLAAAMRHIGERLVDTFGDVGDERLTPADLV